MRHKAMSDEHRRGKSAGPLGLKIHRDNRNHALTGVAIKCRAFGPYLATGRKICLSAFA